MSRLLFYLNKLDYGDDDEIIKDQLSTAKANYVIVISIVKEFIELMDNIYIEQIINTLDDPTDLYNYVYSLYNKGVFNQVCNRYITKNPKSIITNELKEMMNSNNDSESIIMKIQKGLSNENNIDIYNKKIKSLLHDFLTQ